MAVGEGKGTFGGTDKDPSLHLEFEKGTLIKR